MARFNGQSKWQFLYHTGGEGGQTCVTMNGPQKFNLASIISYQSLCIIKLFFCRHTSWCPEKPRRLSAWWRCSAPDMFNVIQKLWPSSTPLILSLSSHLPSFCSTQIYTLQTSRYVQWRTEYRTSLVFKWPIRGWMPNGLVFECLKASFWGLFRTNLWQLNYLEN